VNILVNPKTQQISPPYIKVGEGTTAYRLHQIGVHLYTCKQPNTQK